MSLTALLSALAACGEARDGSHPVNDEAFGGSPMVSGENDRCEVASQSSEGKIGPGLVEQIAEAPGGNLGVVISVLDDDAAMCVSNAIVESGGSVRDVLQVSEAGHRFIIATLPSTQIEQVAGRADVQNVDAEFDDTPPP